MSVVFFFLLFSQLPPLNRLGRQQMKYQLQTRSLSLTLYLPSICTCTYVSTCGTSSISDTNRNVITRTVTTLEFYQYFLIFASLWYPRLFLAVLPFSHNQFSDPLDQRYQRIRVPGACIGEPA